uniref:Uncharacterized protein n=1 Tax=Solanum lycopersicum TaxID=4081 RepID=A0A3Q7IU05_SOLLC
MFSAGDDKQVTFWDLEQNKAIHSFHGHLHGVYCLAIHPTIYVFYTGSRDCVCRVWDIRTKTNIHVFSGHENTISSTMTLLSHPQVVVTSSHDSTMKLWDIRYGKTMETLTHHKKSIRVMARTKVQPGLSIDTDVAIYALTYDVTGTILITCEGDKTIKMWKQR